jgi:uncharacterized delta-60 repeat protein
MLVAVLLPQGAINYTRSLEAYAAIPLTEDTFGDGYVTTDFGSGDDYGHAVAIQTDGKIVVAGNTHNGIDTDFGVVRYNSDGSLDTTFGSDGKVTTNFGYHDRLYAVALQTDGKIVAMDCCESPSQKGLTNPLSSCIIIPKVSLLLEAEYLRRLRQ